MKLDDLFERPYGFAMPEKSQRLTTELTELTAYHLEHCISYRRLFEHLGLAMPPYKNFQDVPWLPVSLFKEHELLSVPRESVYKILTSSGTTGSTPSKIFLDQTTARLQTLGLASIMTHFLGKERLPMLIVDSQNVFKDPKMFSARGAGILGMLNFGREPFYLLDHPLEELQRWAERYAEGPVLIFGFTFMVWEHLLKTSLQLPQGVLFHSGGWKKLQDMAVTSREFKQELFNRLQIRRCHNFYGMAEQVGSVFVECEEGLLHSPSFAEVVFRNPTTWHPAEEGVIEVFSLLPRSYPGHVLLTEDLGKSSYLDRCPCGRKGRAFEVLGRIPQTEPRGCSDVG